MNPNDIPGNPELRAHSTERKLLLPPVALCSEPPPRSDPWKAVRWVLEWNLTYPLSAALLLYGFYLISADKQFLKTEVAQLAFNLGSLQLYEVLLVLTAVFLAGRAIWYDSALLVGLENLLVLVPFILISQAALIDRHLVWGLCAGVALIAAGRVGILKRGYRELNLPKGLLAAGAFVLVVNAALPVVYRILHESKVGQNPDWGAAYETNQYVWWLLVPVLCGLANLVPLARENAGSLSPQNRWLPPGWFALWLVGTGMHLYCLGYVYDFKLRDDLLAPGLWMLSWTAWFCLNRMLGMAARRWTLPMLGLPLVLTWFAVSASHQPVFLVLAGLNVAVYGVVFLRRRVELAMHLGLVSLVTFVAALRLPWGNAIVPEFSRGNFVASGLAVYLLTLGTLRRQPRAGLLGGILAGLAIGMVLRGENHLHWALQGGLVYLLVHSLFWTEPEEDGAGVLRGVAAAGWVLHSALWVHWANAGWAPCFTGVIVLGVCLAARCYTGRWGSVVVVWAGALVAATPPAHSAVVQVWTAPTGLLAIIGSFVLLGLGTLGALNRHRWAAE